MYKWWKHSMPALPVSGCVSQVIGSKRARESESRDQSIACPETCHQKPSSPAASLPLSTLRPLSGGALSGSAAGGWEILYPQTSLIDRVYRDPQTLSITLEEKEEEREEEELVYK